MDFGAAGVADDPEPLTQGRDDRQAESQARAVVTLDKPGAGVGDNDREQSAPYGGAHAQLAFRIGVGVHDGVRGGLCHREADVGDPFGVHSARRRDARDLAADHPDSQWRAGDARLKRGGHPRDVPGVRTS